MTPDAARDLLILSTGFSGLLAGASADRYVVQVPAWRQLDVMIWAEHSRHADLGNGRFWYPVLAFMATALSIAATVGLRQQPSRADAVVRTVYLGALFELVGLSLTLLAAPNLLRLRKPRDLDITERSFRLFHRWGLARAVFQISAFPIFLWALYLLVRAS